MTFSFQTKHTIKVMSVILATAFISACSSTTSSEPTPTLRVSNNAKNNNMSNNYYQSIDAACEQQAIGMDSFAQQSGQAAQYLASAKAMLRCVNGIQFPKGHPDADKALRLMALSVMNFVKGGDIDEAQVALRKTQSKFPNKDLYFADYSSFFDTATALLEQQKLSRHQLAALNISADLRNEIERHQYWLSH
jgi:outer membrane murein-binding lipoprotein Lpp